MTEESPPPAPPAPLSTQADRLKRETLDRLLGRLGDAERQALAFAYAHRTVTQTAPRVLKEKGAEAWAERLAALPAISDETTAKAARDGLAPLHAQADKARLAEEDAAGGLADGPGTLAAHVLSLTLESIKATLGEAGLKVNVSGTAAPVNKAVVNVGGPPRALVAGRYAQALAATLGEDAKAAEEMNQKVEAQDALKSRRVI